MAVGDYSYRVLPHANDEPTFAWAAHRLLHAADRLHELEALHDRSASEWVGRLSLSVNPNDPTAGVVIDFPEALDNFEAFGPPISARASEVIHHLRSALDYVAFHAAWRDSGERNEKALFPLELKRRDWKGREKTYLLGVNAEHRAWIYAVQPFNGVLWARQLKLLSNSDKHFEQVRVVPALGIVASSDVLSGPDPNREGYFLLEEKEQQLEILITNPTPGLADGDEYLDASQFLWALIHEVCQVVNRFLVSEGASPIVMGSAPRKGPGS